MTNITSRDEVREMLSAGSWPDVTSDQQGGGDGSSERSPTKGGRKLEVNAEHRAPKSSPKPGEKKQLPGGHAANDFTSNQHGGGDDLSERSPTKGGRKVEVNAEPRPPSPSPERGGKKQLLSPERRSSKGPAANNERGEPIVADVHFGFSYRFPLFDVIYSLFAAVIGSSILISLLAMPLWIVYEAEMLRVNM